MDRSIEPERWALLTLISIPPGLSLNVPANQDTPPRLIPRILGFRDLKRVMGGV